MMDYILHFQEEYQRQQRELCHDGEVKTLEENIHQKHHLRGSIRYNTVLLIISRHKYI